MNRIITLILICSALTVWADEASLEKEINKLKKQIESLNKQVDSIEDNQKQLKTTGDKVNQFLSLSGYIEFSAGKFKDTDDYYDNDNSQGEVDWMAVETVELIFDFDFRISDSYKLRTSFSPCHWADILPIHVIGKAVAAGFDR